MEEDHDYTPSEENEEENYEQKVLEAEQKGIELRDVYILKEIELKQLYLTLSQIAQRNWEEKEKQYNQSANADPFIVEYLTELQEEGFQLDSIKAQQIEKDHEKDILLKKIDDCNQSQKTTIEYFKTLNDVHIGFKSLIEDLNNQIFKCYQHRLELEEKQNEFNHRIKQLRIQIRDVTEKNGKLVQEIDNCKTQE